MRRRDELYAWLRAHPIVPDAALAVALFLLLSVQAAYNYEPGWPHLALGAAMFGALVFRRIRPVESFATVALTGLVQWTTNVDLTAADGAILLSLYSVSAYGPRWASRTGLAVGIVAAVLASQRYVLVQSGSGAFVTGVGMYSAAVVGVWALGDVRRIRQAYLDELVERARQAERERDQRAQIAAADERARIAREMHDVIAHNLSVIVVQADGGRYAAGRDPSSAVSALSTIATTGRGALAEMRRLLGILRSGDKQDDDLLPQPELTRLPELIESFQSAGLAVEVEVEGNVRTDADGPSLAVYRAIQEALTNVLKHAGPAARAKVKLVYRDDGIGAEVADDGRGAASASDERGLGLAGMRERLELYGGVVSAGPQPGGGWRVIVTMPSRTESE